MAMNDPKDVPLYPIRTVCRLTGVNDKTLRAWEGRYGLIEPARTAGGHRLFSQEDVRRIREIYRMLHVEGISMIGVKRLLSEGDGDE